MTANQQRMMLMDLVDKNTTLSTSGLSDAQISDVLTLGYFQWLKTTMNNLGNKYRKGFDSDEIRKKGLSELIKTIKLLPNQSGTLVAQVDGLYWDSINIFVLETIDYDRISVADVIEVSLDNGDTWTSRTVGSKTNTSANPRHIDIGAYTANTKPVSIKYTYEVPAQSLSTLAMNGEPYGSLWRLPKDCLWLITERTVWNDPNKCWDATFAYVKPTAYDDYNLMIDNKFKKPSKNIVWRLDYSREYNANVSGFKPYGEPVYTGNDNDVYALQTGLPVDEKRHILVTDGTPIGAYFITYIRRPRGIWVDTTDDTKQVHCEVEAICHPEIVNEAAKILMVRLGDPRYGLQSKEQSEQE